MYLENLFGIDDGNAGMLRREEDMAHQKWSFLPTMDATTKIFVSKLAVDRKSGTKILMCQAERDIKVDDNECRFLCPTRQDLPARFLPDGELRSEV